MQVDKEISDKIKFLCREISREEWSGVLFYSVEGTIADPRNMVINLKDIFPMHKGSGVYTEYSFDESLMNFRMDNPELNYFKIGHMHSHNTMNTFFSGTDTSELHDNSVHHNYYLSVIVNNFFDITARVAFRGTIGSTVIKGKNEDGVEYELATSQNEEVMFYYECSIITSEPVIMVNLDFKDRVKAIIAEAAKPKPIAAIGTTTSKDPLINQNWKEKDVYGWKPKMSFDKPQRYEIPPESQEYHFNNQDAISNLEDLEDVKDEENRNNEIEDFLTELLTSHPDYLAHGHDIVILEDAFIYLKENMKSMDIRKYFDYIMEEFPELYASTLEPVEGQESFLNKDVETMIEMVEEFRVEYKHANIFLNRLLNFQKLIEDDSNTAKVDKI